MNLGSISEESLSVGKAQHEAARITILTAHSLGAREHTVAAIIKETPTGHKPHVNRRATRALGIVIAWTSARRGERLSRETPQNAQKHAFSLLHSQDEGRGARAAVLPHARRRRRRSRDPRSRLFRRRADDRHQDSGNPFPAAGQGDHRRGRG